MLLNSLGLRVRKEAHVSGLTGSSLADVLYVTTLPSVLVVLFECLASVLPTSVSSLTGKRPSKFRQLFTAVLEMLLIICPQILQLTIPDEDHLVFKCTCAATVAAMLLARLCRPSNGAHLGSHPLRNSIDQRPQRPENPQNQHPEHQQDDSHRGDRTKRNEIDHVNDRWIPETFKRIQDAVSMHRANVMLMTCLAILGVDFRAFPRKYAKTEFSGTSLMDAGVGSIILCSSFVEGLKVMGSSRYRAKEKQNRLKETSLRSLLRILFLVVLGVGRPLSLWIIGYQVHEGEYGMHWNFFLTLAVMRAAISNVPRSSSPLIIGAMLLGAYLLLISIDIDRSIDRDGVSPLQPPHPLHPDDGFVSLALFARPPGAHQYGLSFLGMTDLVNDTSSRRQASLFFQNKEGIVSLTGYLALHFLGVWCAKVYAYLNSRPRHGLMQGWNTLHVFGVSVLWAAFYYVDAYVERVSRRSCNAAFILWMLAINCQAVLFNTLCLNVISAIAGGRLETSARSNDRYSRRNSAGSSSSLSGRRKVLSAYLPPLYNAVNRGMLYVFLWANLSTGAVNALLVKDTLRLEDSEARQILALHMALVVGGSLLTARCSLLAACR